MAAGGWLREHWAVVAWAIVGLLAAATGIAFALAQQTLFTPGGWFGLDGLRVLDAATTLFATRGPASVSVRDIAAAAGVNHALVHRHFGSKQEVLRAVLERTVREVAAIAAEITDARAGMGRLFAASAAHETYWRALARALLDGENPRTLQRDFPTVHRLIALLQAAHKQRRHHKEYQAPNHS